MTPSEEDLAKVAPLIVRLYEIVDALEELFPGRSFTPDGHLVGSIGEALAAYVFDLQLMPASYRAFDARTAGGKTVEVKATQGNAIALSAYADPIPDRLIALRILRTGMGEVVYNGPAAPVWAVASLAQKNGQRRVGLGALRRLQVLPGDQLPLVRNMPCAPDDVT